MRSKRIKKKHASSLAFQYKSYKTAKAAIKDFLEAMLSCSGLVPGVDFLVTCNNLIIKHVKQFVGQLTILLKEAFPVFNYYWETPRILVWF